MQKNHIIALGMAAAMLAGSCIAQAEDSGTRTELDQRNRIWSMQGVTDGTYTGDAERHQVQTQTQEQVRTRSYTGTGSGSRYGQGYESRQASGGLVARAAVVVPVVAAVAGVTEKHAHRLATHQAKDTPVLFSNT